MNHSKLHPPRPIRVFERDRLMNRLHDWDACRLVIIHAQAGQGKSTLAAEYARSLSTPYAWYNMDQEDENPDLFLSLLSEAVRCSWPALVPAALPIPWSRHAAGSTGPALSAWIGQVFGGLPHGSLVIFDDFPGASSSTLVRIMNTLIHDAPPQVRFMIISRSRPPFDLARLRAARTLGELAGQDLRFSDSEVQMLFGIIFRMHISPSEAALINSAVEGWPAGLVLMHEYLSSLAPGARSLAIADRRSSGFQTHVFDYLAQEVFAQLPDSTQQFLLRTSIADNLPLELIELLTGRLRAASPRSQSIAAMVKDLQNRNLFITAVDDGATVVRYHALFREFLRRKLIAQIRPMEVRRLYTIAAAFFMRNGDPVQSIDLTLSSGGFDRAVKQIESCGEEMIARGQSRTLLRWIEALPLEHGNRPWFLFYRAVATRFTDPRTALTFFELALKGFRSKDVSLRSKSGSMHALCGIIETSFHAGGDFKHMARAASLAASLLRKKSRESPGTRARLLLAAGMAWFFLGKLQQSREALQQALALFRKQEDRFSQITTAIYLTPCALYQGDFPAARAALSAGFEALAEIPQETGSRAALYLTKAMASLFEGRFDEAQESVDQSSSLADVHALESIGLLSLNIGGWLKIAQGDYPAAEILLIECKRRGEASRNTFFCASAAHLLAIAYLFENRLDQAKKESDYALAAQANLESGLFHAIYLIASGAIHLKMGKRIKAEADLTTSLKELQKLKAVQQEANAHLVLARLYMVQKKPALVRKHLREGFSIGRDLGFTYYALFSAAELSEAAERALTDGICAEYCAGLLSGHAGSRAAAQLCIHSLGDFKVYLGKKQVTDAQLKSAQVRTLLKLLVAHEGRIPRERAWDTLWPGMNSDNAAVSYTSMLHRARKVLDPDDLPDARHSCILLKDGVIILNPDRTWTDTAQFQAHLRAAEQWDSKEQTNRALDEYSKALVMYQGDFLPDDIYQDWAAPMRETLRDRCLRAMETAADLAEKAGDRDRTLQFHEKIFHLDTCNEQSCCWLMLRYQSDGKRNDAIRTYERCERALASEMDMEPDDATRKVYRSIIGG